MRRAKLSEALLHSPKRLHRKVVSADGLSTSAGWAETEERGAQRMRISSPARPVDLRRTPFAPYPLCSMISAVFMSRLRKRRE